AEDLDILGPGSLFQLLSTARTRMGRGCLARWLLAPAGPQEIQARQAAVAELKQKLDLREELAVAGGSERIDAHPEALVEWARDVSTLKDGRWWALLLAALNLAALVYGFIALWTPFLLLILLNGSIMFRRRHQLEKIFAHLSETHKDLDSLAEVLRRIEEATFSSQRLIDLQAALRAQRLQPSERIPRLDTLSDRVVSRHNCFVRLFDVPLLYSLQLAFALEGWRRKYGSRIDVWLNVVGEIEPLASLAAYAYEHAPDPFPEFLPAGSSPSL